MNKKITYDYELNYKEITIEQNIKKFYQMYINNINVINDKSLIIELDNQFEYPEYDDLEYEIVLQSVKFKEFFHHIDKFYDKYNDFIIFLTYTIIGVKNIEDGVYSYNIYTKKIHRIKKIDEELNCILKELNKFNICLSMFSNIKKSIVIYKEVGFIKSIIQIGKLLEHNLINSSFIQVDNGNVIMHQKFTHALGINLYNQLLIENQYFLLGDD